MRLRACDHCTLSTLIDGKGRAGPSSFYTMLEGLMEYVNARGMSSVHGVLHDIKWIMFHGHLGYFQKPPLEVGWTQNRETMALWNLTTIDLLYYIICEDPTWIEIHWNSIWSRAWSHISSHYTWRLVITLHDFGSVLGRPLDFFGGALTILRSRFLVHVWSGHVNEALWMEGVWSWANHIQAIHSHRLILQCMKLLGQPNFFISYFYDKWKINVCKMKG